MFISNQSNIATYLIGENSNNSSAFKGTANFCIPLTDVGPCFNLETLSRTHSAVLRRTISLEEDRQSLKVAIALP